MKEKKKRRKAGLGEAFEEEKPLEEGGRLGLENLLEKRRSLFGEEEEEARPGEDKEEQP